MIRHDKDTKIEGQITRAESKREQDELCQKRKEPILQALLNSIFFFLKIPENNLRKITVATV